MKRLLALVIDRMTFLKAHEKRTLYDGVASIDGYLGLTLDDVAICVGRPLASRRWHPSFEMQKAEEALRWLDNRQVRLALLPRGFDKDSPGGDSQRNEGFYPPLLAEIYDPPFLLYIQGELPSLRAASVAVVGTRRPDAQAARAAVAFGRDAAAAGHLLISGLARGIDSMVHRGAVSKGRGGVAILGSGIDVIYPKENRGLATALLDRGGVLVSEYPPGVPPLKHHFPARNRIISGLAQGVLLVQAPQRSGALITIDYALDQGREVFVHSAGLPPGFSVPEQHDRVADGERGAGGAELALNGAPVVHNFAGVAQQLGFAIAYGANPPDDDSADDIGLHGGPVGSRNTLVSRMSRQLQLGGGSTW